MQKIKFVFNGSFYDKIVWLEPTEEERLDNMKMGFLFTIAKKLKF